MEGVIYGVVIRKSDKFEGSLITTTDPTLTNQLTPSLMESGGSEPLSQVLSYKIQSNIVLPSMLWPS